MPDVEDGGSGGGGPFRQGDEFAGLVLEGQLGEGGFGVTWQVRATERADSQSVAMAPGDVATLKIFRLEDGWKSIDLLERETKVLQRLQHPSIPKYLGSVVQDRPSGRDFGLAYAYVEGTSLESLVRSGQWMPDANNMRYLAEALLDVCAHLASFAPPIVHRDIKPANIVVERPPLVASDVSASRGVFLVDFGAAVLGGGLKTTAMGTFGYMAPESFAQVFTPKSDLYGVGASLLYAATGRQPGDFPQDRLRIQFRDAFKGTIYEREEPWLAELLEGLLAPAPEDRFSSAAEALAFVQRAAEGGGRLELQEPPAPRGPSLTQDGGRIVPPKNSVLQVERQGFELKVLIPSPGVAETLLSETSIFGITWTGFTAFWTTGVLAAGGGVMALFSLPFWSAGYAMLKDQYGPLLKGAMWLKIGREKWSYGHVGRKDMEMNTIEEGRTENLLCELKPMERTFRPAVRSGPRGRVRYASPPSSSGHRLKLTDGAYTLELPEGRLQEVERQWLADVIRDHLDRCREGRGA